MKTLRLLGASFAGFSLAGLVACGPITYALRGSPIDPSADGSVNVNRGDNGNTILKVRVQHLAPANRIDPNASTFVVWASPEGGDPRPQSLGALRVNKDLDGELDSVTVLEHFRLFITAEPSAGAEAPSGPHLLEAMVDHVK